MQIKDLSGEMEKSVSVQIRIFKPDNTVEPGAATVITEHRVRIFLNDRLILRLVCTPEHLKELVIGRLLTDGYIDNIEEISHLHICDSGHAARVYLQQDAPVNITEQVAEEPTCCTNSQVIAAAAKRLQKLPAAKWEPRWIFALTKVFREDSKLHKSTFGTHSCYLAVEGKVLWGAEDIGRHNAMDKAIGYAALEGICPEQCILFTTGRVPVDMVTKAVAAGVPVLVSKAVPTTEAVELAKEYGLTLICGAWPDQFGLFA